MTKIPFYRAGRPHALAGLALSALLCGGCGSHGESANVAASDAAADSAEPTVQVQTTSPVKRSVADTVTLYGEVVPDVGASENISFQRPVRISRLIVSAGQRVQANQPLLEIENDPAAVATFQQAQSALTLARKELSAQEQLFQERLTTQAQLAAARKSLADAEATLSAERKAGAGVSVQVIRATRAGTIATLSAQQGDRVQPGTTVLQIARSGGQRVLLGAEPEDVAHISPAMPVKVSPVFGGEGQSGSVSQVFAVINPQTRLVDIAVRLTDGASLMPGTKVRGDVSLAPIDVWLVPASAVLQDAEGSYLFQVAGGKARRVAVGVRIEGDRNLGVTGELKPDEPVVTTGNYELDEGTPVRNASK